MHGGQVTALAIVFAYLVWYAILIDGKLEGRRRGSWPKVLAIPLIFTLRALVIVGIFLVIRWFLSGNQYAAAERERHRQQYQADLYAQAMYQQGKGPY